MPTFIFQKLIRDKLVEEYERMGQMATYRELSDDAYVKALVQKLREEIEELAAAKDRDAITGELADIEQVIKDMMNTHSIADGDVETKRQEKLAKKGGFSGRHFVETLHLKPDDEWVEYYRKEPDVFKEIEDS